MSSSDGGRPPGKPPGKPGSSASSTLAGVIPPGPSQPPAPTGPPGEPRKRTTLPPPVRGAQPPAPHHAPPTPQQPYGQPPSAPHPGQPPSGPAPQQPSAPPHGQPPSGPQPAPPPYAQQPAPQQPAGQPPSGPVPQQAAAAPYGQPPYAQPASGPQGQPASGPTPYPASGVPQPYGGPQSGATQPTAQPPSVPVPQPGGQSGPTQPYAYPPSGPDHGYAPSGPVPHAPFPPSPSYPVPAPHLPGPGDSIEEVPGSKFVSFLKISTRRAFRLRIEPAEVLPAERASLERASPPILDRNLQAFLAWRRSVLFLVAVALVPLALIGLIDAFRNTKYTAIFVVRGAPAAAEAVFCYICWTQLKQWAHWRTQRRKLFWGWLLFLITPFIVFIYPLRTIFVELGGSSREKLAALGVEGVYRQAVMPFVFAMLAMLQLAPKAISLMPGLIRASMVIKLLFPGSSAPGWLIVMAAPLYALLAYVILIIPYQFTGSGWFIAGVLGVVAGQAFLARAGFALAKPLEEEESLRQIKRVRVYYVTVMIVSAVLIVVALGSLVEQFNMRVTDVITAVLKFETNVLILTMIGADLVVTNLDRARTYTAGRAHVEEETEVKIAAFVSLQAPPPPPPGPAS